MKKISRHRWRRLWASASPILLGAGPVILAPLVVAFFSAQLSGAVRSPTVPIWALLVGVIIAIGLLGLRCMSEYRKRTYDPAWVLKFCDTFDGKEMKTTRSRAAKALSDDGGKLNRDAYASPNVDDVLDFFDDLGFYLQGDQITPEVAHHAFHYWIRGYYSAAKPYLENKQQQRLTQWEWVPFLLEATHEIEVERNGQVKKLLDAPDVEKFLAEEMNVPDQKHVRRRS